MRVALKVRAKGKDQHVVTMRSKAGAYEHHIIGGNEHGLQINGTLVPGVLSLEDVIDLLSRDNQHVPTVLNEAICIPHIASDVGTVPWVHGAMPASGAEDIVGGTNGGQLGMFFVYESPTSNQTLVVVQDQGFTHKIVTKDNKGVFCLDGDPIIDEYGSTPVTDWVGFRQALAMPNKLLGTQLKTAVCRERCPVDRLCSAAMRPAWLYDPISRKSAGHLLAGCTDTSFLVRESINSPFEFKLDHVQNRAIHHNLVKFANGEWAVDQRPVRGCNTLEDVLNALKDVATSGLPFVITKPIENEESYMIIPALEVLIEHETKLYDGVYNKARPASEAVYMDDLLLAGNADSPVYSMAGNNASEQVVVDPSSGAVYQASGAAVADEYMTAGDALGEYMTSKGMACTPLPTTTRAWLKRKNTCTSVVPIMLHTVYRRQWCAARVATRRIAFRWPPTMAVCTRRWTKKIVRQPCGKGN